MDQILLDYVRFAMAREEVEVAYREIGKSYFSSGTDPVVITATGFSGQQGSGEIFIKPEHIKEMMGVLHARLLEFKRDATGGTNLDFGAPSITNFSTRTTST